MADQKKLKVHLVMTDETRWRLRQLAARANVDMSQYVADYINAQYERIFGNIGIGIKEGEASTYAVQEGAGVYGVPRNESGD